MYEQQKQFDAAIRELTMSRMLAPRSSRPIALLAHAFVAARKRPEALRVLAELKDRASHQYVPALDFAIVYAGLGDRDQAFVWLDSARADKSIRPYLRDPTFDSIRSDTRYSQLMRRLNLASSGS